MFRVKLVFKTDVQHIKIYSYKYKCSKERRNNRNKLKIITFLNTGARMMSFSI